MDQVLIGLTFTAAYLDDIVIYSETWEKHMEHIREVLQCLQEAGLTVNSWKCVIAKAETEYLGFVIGKGVIRPQVEKVRAIEVCPQPRTRKELRSFLGMAGFYNKFMPNFSSRAAVLTDMVGSRSPNQLRWTREAEAAFQDIRTALSKDSVLHNPDFNQSFILQTDASDRGLGAVLLQGGPNAQRPIAFLSRKLSPGKSAIPSWKKNAWQLSGLWTPLNTISWEGSSYWKRIITVTRQQDGRNTIKDYLSLHG